VGPLSRLALRRDHSAKPSRRSPPALERGRRRMAERVGFEPTVEFPLHTLSKRAPSTTRTSLRVFRIWHLQEPSPSRQPGCAPDCALTPCRRLPHISTGGHPEGPAGTTTGEPQRFTSGAEPGHERFSIARQSGGSDWTRQMTLARGGGHWPQFRGNLALIRVAQHHRMLA
jgi:hypothetical protein